MSRRRWRRRATARQTALVDSHARKLGSSQSRVAKMEAGDPSVTVDLLIRSLLTLGATTKTVARTIENTNPDYAA